MNILPVKIDDLIHARSVESVRLEFKKTWSQPIKDAVIKSICAFANDFLNLNGGYVVLGIEEDGDGRPRLPPNGLDDQDLDEIQKWISGNCRRIEPEYQPILSPEMYQEQQILVIWIPAGDLRPYQAPKQVSNRNVKERAYYIRQGSQTAEAKGDMLTQLMQLTAKVPFDDRRNLTASIDDISPALVRNYLSDVKSDLMVSGASISEQDLYQSLGLIKRVNGYYVPKNVALLFFVDDPERFFPGARIEIVEFGDDAGGDLIEEKIFRGPLHAQLRQALNYLNSFSTTMVRKVPDQAEAQRTVSYPYEAMEEALVNAVYHRSYEGIQEPVKVYLYPDRLEITSYPGPVPGIEMNHFAPGVRMPNVRYRNRRIGDFLKDLRLAEARGTGIPKIRRKMTQNGSPEPLFEFDEGRSYFQVTLPAHPQYIIIHAIRESAYLWAGGDRQRAILNLESALDLAPDSGALVAQIIEYRAALGEHSAAQRLFSIVENNLTMSERHLPYISMAKTLLDRGQMRRAAELLDSTPAPSQVDESVELAILHKRAKRFQQAHRIFTTNYESLKDNPKYLHEFAQTKNRIAGQKHGHARKRLNEEALGLLRRAIQLSSDDIVRNAWCWYDLAKTLNWLRASETEIRQAFEQAIELLPDEVQFSNYYRGWEQRMKSN